MRGETVKVVRYTPTGETDPGGSPVTKVDIESVDNVLVSPGAMSNATDSIRPDGVTVAFTCLFPRSYAYRSLRGASVRINSHDYEVIGDPRPLGGGMKPTAWNLTVEVTDAEEIVHETGETALFGIPGVQAQRGARAALSERAQKIAARANSMAAPTHAGQPSYTAEGPRANDKGATVLVHTDNLAARIDNAVRDTLAKALGGG